MLRGRCWLFQTLGSFSFILLAVIFVANTGGMAQQSAAAPDNNNLQFKEGIFNRANAAFKSGQWDRALELSERLANAPTSKTEHTHFRVRSRTLRAVIYTGELQARKELAEAYREGAAKITNPQFKAEYRRLHDENLRAAAQAALGLAYTAHQLAEGGVIGTTEPLDTVYPTIEGPIRVAELTRISEGEWLEPQQRESVAAACLRKGMDDALAEILSGDRLKAQSVLGKGPIDLDGAALAIFLARNLLTGAIVFDAYHEHDPLKVKSLCEEGKETLKAAQALLKANPNESQQQVVDKLQNRFDSILKNG